MTITLSFFQKNSLFILEKETKSSVMCEMERGRQRQTVILTHNFWATQCYLQSLTSSLPRRRTQRVLIRRPPTYPQPWFSICRLDWPLLAEINSKLRLQLKHSHGQLHSSFHNTHNFCSTMQLLPLIFTSASCAENLWLTARSRVNKQHR